MEWLLMGALAFLVWCALTAGEVWGMTYLIRPEAAMGAGLIVIIVLLIIWQVGERDDRARVKRFAEPNYCLKQKIKKLKQKRDELREVKHLRQEVVRLRLLKKGRR